MKSFQAGDETVERVGIDVVGGLRVRVGVTVLGPRDLGGTKPRRLLLALVLARGATVCKDRLVTMLWDGALPVASTATVEAYVCVLRKHLQPAGSSRASLIQTRPGGYGLDMQRVDLDVARRELLASRYLHASSTAEDAVVPLRQAFADATLPLLPDEPSIDWVEQARSTYAARVRASLVAAAEKVAAVAPVEAARWARTALEDDPLDESAWYAYLHTKELAGDHADGLRAYDQCRRRFAEELGCAPGPRLQALYGRLLSGVDGDEQELGHLIEAVVRLHHDVRGTPVPLTSQAGRRGAPDQITAEQARSALAALLSQSSARRPRIVSSVSA